MSRGKAPMAGALAGLRREREEGSPLARLSPREPHVLEESRGRAAKDIFLLPLDRIELQGEYIRRHLDEESPEFTRLWTSLAARKEPPTQPISVRIVRDGGTDGSQTNGDAARAAGGIRYVLVYGMRRLRATQRAYRETGAPELSQILVRNLGEISEAESLRIQTIENELRQDPHVVDTAYGFWLLQQELGASSNREIADEVGVKPGYFSEMHRVGHAIALCDDGERGELYAGPGMTVRLFQEIAKLPGAEERKQALLRVARGQPTEAASQAERRRQSGPFLTRQHRNGRAFQLRWRREDVLQDPEAFVGEFRTHFSTELEHLAAFLEEAAAPRRRRGARPGADEIEKISRALHSAREILNQMDD
jgi:hypothetical protein